MTKAGVIHRLFPDAKFILSLRHPCDCVLSCYMQPFRLNYAMINFLTLQRSAELYHAAMSLWTAYTRVLDLSAYQIRYEDLIEDVPGTCAPLMQFMGLDWREDQANAQQTALTRGRIATPSYNQVTKPIYKDARGRWGNYRAQMDPVLPLLTPWAERYGYSV
jgi:hypothetical protein